MLNKRFDRERLAATNYVALILPYKKGSYQVDESAYRRLIRKFLAEEYLEENFGFIVNPEAGEVFYLRPSTYLQNIRVVMQEVRGKAPVVAGVCALRTDDYVGTALTAKKEGVDGIFLMPPLGSGDVVNCWNAEDAPEVWINMAKAVAEETDLPLVTHPVGGDHFGRWGGGLPLPATIRMCREVPSIVGWKMTYGDRGSYVAVAKALRTLKPKVGVLTASGVLFNMALTEGLKDGSLSGAYNYAPDLMLEHMRALEGGDLKRGRRVWETGLSDLQEYIYSDRNSRLHIRYKIATWLRGFIPSPVMIPPMPEPRKEEIETLSRLLRNCGVDVVKDKEYVIPPLFETKVKPMQRSIPA